MQKKIIICFLFLMLAGTFPGFSQETALTEPAGSEKANLSERKLSKSDSLNAQKTEAFKDRVAEYVSARADKIPHHTFWDRTTQFFHDVLYRASETLFPASWKGFIQSVIDIIFEIPLLIILLLLSCTFIINVTIVTIIIVIVSYFKRAREAYKETLNTRFEDILTKYLFYDVSLDDVLIELRQVKTNLGRDLLLDIFFNYHRNLSGEYRDRILELYNRMELFKISEKRTRSMHTYKRVKGIRELANMYPSGAKNLILKYVTDKNSTVRSEAQIAYAHLDEDTSFSFLDNLDQKLSTWVQLNILNYVKLHERNVPSFHKWIDSPNKDVQDFSIRMMNYFQQNENAEYLIPKLDHPDEQTRSYVYQTIRHLSLFEGKEPAKAKYEDESMANKVEILKVVRDLGDEQDFSFLIGVLKGEIVPLKVYACEAFYRMGDSGKAFLKDYSETEDFDLKRFIEHIKDQRN
ncbi:HEAT repeat domain-containing protein [Mangrovibacterium lignilyticum]|uniref:HEAT repeat domain-containing protein n=1 Tax=Mangrovibacterium lignilyticum TaxID=2668052 RepID=UPI0013D628C6|nr:hypothetical protein [Mangrovibacterium lignilyticum]